jgi:hypothetical protein
MKKFIHKTLTFLSPFILLYLITEIFYVSDQGDLLRLGFMFGNSSYYDKINKKYEHVPLKYKKITETNLEKDNKFTVLTIGDSFSDKGNLGYNNYLANYEGISVTHFCLQNYENPVQTMYSLVNGDFFEKSDIKFVVLESVERRFVDRVEKLDTNSILTMDSILIYLRRSIVTKKPEKKRRLFNDKFMKIPYVNFMYLFNAKPSESKTYKVNISDNLFTGQPNKLLFYQGDIKQLSYSNDSVKVCLLNHYLNKLALKLAKKRVKLVVLPCPDKYDFYYDYIVESDKYPKPMFFKYMSTFPKTYMYVDSKEILKKVLKETKDVYYYDDTHWTPGTAKIIAKEIASLISDKNTTAEMAIDVPHNKSCL